MSSTFYKSVRSLLKFKNRADFLKILPKNAVGAELGVFRGAFSNDILRVAQPKELHLIDVWWSVYGETFPDWGVYTDYGKLKTKTAYDEVAAITKKYDCNSSIHVGDDLFELTKFDDNYFDWVYIDSKHEYEHAIKELHILQNKVKPGGIISGHDYEPDPTHVHHGVYKAVHEFCEKNAWEIFYKDGYMQWAIRRIGSI